MKFSHVLAAAAVVAALAAPAFAQPYSIGTGKQGSLAHGVGAAISNLMNDKAGLEFRVKPGGGPASVLKQTDAGKADFGVNDAAESRLAYAGKGASEGKPHKNIRLVTMVFPLRISLAVPHDSRIKRIGDAKGMRMGYKYTAENYFQFVADALLAGDELKQSDMKNTPYSRVIPTGYDLARGKIDIAIVTPGSDASKKHHAMLKSHGGLRFLAINSTPEGVKRMNEVYPEAFPLTVQPSGATPGVIGPTAVMAYPYFLIAGAHVPDDVVYKVVMTIRANKDYLAETNSRFELFDPDRMRAYSPVPFHPGADKAYRELGMM